MNIQSDKLGTAIMLEQAQQEYKEAIDIFPALHKYQIEHNILNLQKLCIEISEFCQAIYSSTQNNDERSVYFKMLENLQKRQP